MIDTIKKEAEEAAEELIETAKLEEGAVSYTHLRAHET